MKLGLGLYLRLEQSSKLFINPILGLSPLELELLLDQSLEQVSDFHEKNPNWRDENPLEERGNYFWQGDFLDGCKSVRGKVSREQYLETPQIFVDKGEAGYSTKYNSQINERIAEKLARFKRIEEQASSADNIFSKQFAKQRDWIVKQQLAIVKYLCETQDQYLESGNKLNLNPITQLHVAEHLGYSDSTITRLVKNLTIHLPDGKVLFVYELIPGFKATIIKGTYALRELQQNSDLYDNGEWKISDSKLVPILKERFGIEVARRTVSKYKSRLG